MKIYRFKAQALTPVHVGSGREIDPLQFILRDNRLVHFSPYDVLTHLPTDDRQRFIELAERADLKAIQSFFRAHVDPQLPNLVHVDISEQFRREFEEKASNPNNQFRVDMMPRNPHSGRAYLPGSSIKGAIRTALVNYFANVDPATRQAVHQAVQAERDDKRKGRLLEEKALNRRQSETERDVLRLLEVEDVTLPDASTRIDRAINWNPKKPDSQNIQIWIERLKSLADGTNAPSWTVNLHLDMRAMKHSRVQETLGRTIDFETVLKACNRFYWGRMVAERDKFDANRSAQTAWSVLHSLFPRGRLQDGPTFVIDPASEYWCYRQKKRMLLRVGRFAHFESLSVDKLRQGYNIQAKRVITDMGATRTRCDMGKPKPPMPFGWVQLTLE